MTTFFKNLEIEWKILLLASIALFAFAYPLQHVYISRLKSTINQSVDPSLEKILITYVKNSNIDEREIIAESLKRHRQWKALIPIIIEDQQHVMIVLSIVLFVLLLIVAFFLLKKMTRPLRELSVAAEMIGKGKSVTIQCKSGGALGKLEATMNLMQNELVKLREKTRAQGMETAWRDIARVMAHEIKNPLTPIQLTLDRIQEKVDNRVVLNNSELEKFVERIGTQVQNLERLVNDFRSFAREPEPDLRSTSLVNCIQPLADDLSGSIKTIISGEDTMVLVDKHLLTRALLNLWKNSLEAGSTKVCVSIQNDNQFVILTIADDGSGIPDELCEQVWIPYVTFKSGGTGLGLPVVKRIIESMNGTISMESSIDKESQGTRFCIKLIADKGNQDDFKVSVDNATGVEVLE